MKLTEYRMAGEYCQQYGRKDTHYSAHKLFRILQFHLEESKKSTIHWVSCTARGYCVDLETRIKIILKKI